MVAKKTLHKILLAFFTQRFKDPKLVAILMDKTLDRIKDLESKGMEVDIEVFDLKAPSREIRTFKVPGANKERQR